MPKVDVPIDSGSNVILRAGNIPGLSLHCGTQSLKRLDEEASLDRHVDRSVDVQAR